MSWHESDPIVVGIVHAGTSAVPEGSWARVGAHLVRTGPQFRFNVANSRLTHSLLKCPTLTFTQSQLDLLWSLSLCEETISMTQILQALGTSQEDSINILRYINSGSSTDQKSAAGSQPTVPSQSTASYYPASSVQSYQPRPPHMQRPNMVN